MKKEIPAKAMEERKKLMLQAINGPPHPSLFYWFVPKYSRPSTSDLRRQFSDTSCLSQSTRAKKQRLSNKKTRQCRQADQRPDEPNKQTQPENCWCWCQFQRIDRNTLAGFVECLTSSTAVQHQFDVYLWKVSFIVSLILEYFFHVVLYFHSVDRE